MPVLLLYGSVQDLVNQSKIVWNNMMLFRTIWTTLGLMGILYQCRLGNISTKKNKMHPLKFMSLNSKAVANLC